ncbi:hypothetical protein B484DRAFT_442842 [Ochromonadaceae sp. CCMP2298]|nr:hypothetical protein B484DRAFT_442842 [Ochromonadaceae sp. CCMP2298]
MERVSARIVPATNGFAELTYTGQMQGGMRDGFGGASWATGSFKSYDGQWREGKIHGQGIMEYSTGDVYEGQYVDGRKHGQGFYRWTSGNSHEGQWMDDKQHGHGLYKSSGGDTHEGQWVEEKRQGRFVYSKAGGTRYERIYENNVITSETIIP